MLLKNQGDHLLLTHDGLLPIDIAGTTPSLESMDAFLKDYSDLNQLSAPRSFHNDFSSVDMYINGHQTNSTAPEIARDEGDDKFQSN